MALTVALVGVAIIAVATLARKKQTVATRTGSGLSASCRTVLVTFIDLKNSSVDANHSARDALNHWHDVWNGYTSGRWSRAQYDAGMNEFRVDAMKERCAAPA